MDADRFNALQVRTLGWNGQIPMLDLYYLIKRLSENGPGLQLSQVCTSAHSVFTHKHCTALNCALHIFGTYTFACCMDGITFLCECLCHTFVNRYIHSSLTKTRRLANKVPCSSAFVLLSARAAGVSLQKMSTPFMHHMPAKLQKYWPDMWKVMTFSWQQATTMPTGLHAEFIQHGIDAVTIETYMQPSQVMYCCVCKCEGVPSYPGTHSFWSTCQVLHARSALPIGCVWCITSYCLVVQHR